MRQAAPSGPVGFGDYGGKNQSLHRDSNPISPGALQIKTQTPVISHHLPRGPGSSENAGRNWCLRKDGGKRHGSGNGPGRGKDLLAQATTSNGQQAFGVPHSDMAKSCLSLCTGSVCLTEVLIPPASPFLVSRCSTLVLQPYATLDSPLLQPQILGK